MMNCLDFLRSLVPRLPPPPDQQQEFAELVGFLSTVPLLRKQLSPADLPLIAQALTVQRWRPGCTVVREGHVNRQLFLVKSGTALVVREGADGERRSVCGTLVRGDHFGGPGLQATPAPQGATVCAAGPEVLVTLSLTRERFEQLGLDRKMSLPKRPAIAGMPIMPLSHGQRSAAEPLEAHTKEEEEFLCRVVKANENLKALMSLEDEAALEIVRLARRRDVAQGESISWDADTRFSSPQAFVMIARGSFDVVIDGGDKGPTSAEAAVARTALARRLLPQRPLGGKVLSNRSHQRSQTAAHGSLQSNESPLKRDRGLNVRKFKSLPHGGARFAVGDCVTVAPEAAARSRGGSVLSDLSTCSSEGEDSGPEREREEVGVVVDTAPTEVVVWFPSGKASVSPESLRRQSRAGAGGGPGPGRLGPGDSFGELPLLYNTRMGATLRAREDAVVYTVDRRDFHGCLQHVDPQVEEFVQALDDVPVLSAMLRSERLELARNAVKRLAFAPGEVVTQQGAPRGQAWYIVEKGEALLLRRAEGEQEAEQLANCRRGTTFGEREHLTNAAEWEITVHAGPKGLTALAVDGEVLGLLAVRAGPGAPVFGLPELAGGAEEYTRAKAACSCMDCGRGRARTEGSEASLGQLQTVQSLGSGGFGCVTLMHDPSGGAFYALKRLSKRHIANAGLVDHITSERDTLAIVDSPFIVHYYRSFADERNIYLLMEALLGGHLLRALYRQPEVFSDCSGGGSGTGFYIACVISALEHLHARCIIYRDLKPENVLLDARGYAKLCDLGFARFCLGKSYTLVGTPAYMAPEMIDSPHGHDSMVDWWALGVLTFELFAGDIPWGAQAVEDPIVQMLGYRGDHGSALPERRLPRGCPQPARDFMRQLLQVRPRRRLGARQGAQEVRQHAWFTCMKFDFEALREERLPSPYRPDAPERGELEALCAFNRSSVGSCLVCSAEEGEACEPEDEHLFASWG